MIQIQSREQFTKAAERLTRERMSVRKSEAHAYSVRNTVKGTSYTVRFTRRDGRTFASCDCPAGLRHNRAPLVCKHMATAILFVKAVSAMRRAAQSH
jgi:uncharacterized Zn finger protein